jgi:hypothetical protein
MGGVGSACLASIKVVILGFLFCEDGDLLEAGTSSSGHDEFRKAPPANVTGHLMHQCFYSDRLVPERAA